MGRKLRLDLNEGKIDFAKCPITHTMGLIGGKWKPVLLNRIQMGIYRFGALRRSMPGISKQILTAQLREMEKDGLLKRKIFAEIPPRVEYSISPLGLTMLPILESMREWGQKHRPGDNKGISKAITKKTQ